MKRIILVILCVVLIFTAVPVSVDFYAKDNASVLSQFPSYVTEKQKEENNLKKRLPKFNNYMINLLPANELNNLKLAVFSSCKTGENYEESNMIGNMFKRGTHYVIGHTNYTYVGPDYVWMVRFMMALDSGNCIYDAMEQADAYLYASGYGSTVGYLNQRHTLGDGSIVLKH